MAYISKEDKESISDNVIVFGGIRSKDGLRREIPYNVSQFLRNYDKNDIKHSKQMDEFITKLDDRVRIDPTDPKYQPIMDAVENFVGRICDEFNSSNNTWCIETHILTGSLYSGVKVGMPFEADYVLYMKNSELAPR